MRVYSSKGNLRTKRKITSDSPRCEKVARLLPALTSLKTPKILWHPSRWHPIQPHPVRGLLPIGGQLSDYWTFKSFQKWMGNDQKKSWQKPEIINQGQRKWENSKRKKRAKRANAFKSERKIPKSAPKIFTSQNFWDRFLRWPGALFRIFIRPKFFNVI